MTKRLLLTVLALLCLFWASTAALAVPKLQLKFLLPQNSAQFIYYPICPTAVAVDSQQNVYISDGQTCLIMKFDANGNLLKQWGSYGTGDGQFQYPQGLAVDRQGNVYVVDCDSWDGNHRIQKFDANGRFLTKWGSYGTGNGQFQYAQGVAVDTLGNVYVADTFNNRIQKFDANGSYLTQWGIPGCGSGQFRCPRGVAEDGNGNVYVADSNNNRIQKFDANGSFLTQWDGNYTYTDCVATDTLGNVYVGGLFSHVQVFDTNGKLLRQWGSYGNLNGQSRDLRGVAVDSSGNVYTANTYDYRLQKFDANGSFLAVWGTGGGENGQFDGGGGIAADCLGNFYVGDSGNKRIQKFDIAGRWLTNWGVPDFYQYGLAQGGRMNLYVAIFQGGPGKSYILKFDPYGNPVATWGESYYNEYHALALDAQGNLYATDGEYNHCIRKFDFQGNMIATLGGDIPNFSPFGVAVDAQGNLYATDHHCIRKLDSNGHLIATWGAGMADFNPLSVALDPWGNVYVTGTGPWSHWPPAETYIRKFNSQGVPVATWTGYGPNNTRFYYPGEIAIKGGNLYVMDGGRVLVFDLPSTGPAPTPAPLGALLLLLLH